MKKQKGPVQGKPPPSGANTFKAPPDRTKADTPAKKSSSSAADKAAAAAAGQASQQLSKTYLSKSHENLASTLRRQATAAARLQSQRPVSSLGLPNKENIQSPGPKSRIPKPQGGSPLRKAQSVQNVDRIGTPVKGTSSAHAPATAKTPSSSSIVRRATSTQNISRDQKARQRASAPANAMAYNAELLASFEKEKKILERRISELIQLAEGRKSDTQKLVYEIKNLKEKIPSHNVLDELEMLRSENRVLKDRLRELGINVEQITDAEKLLQKSSMVKSNSAHTDVSQDDSLSLGAIGTDQIALLKSLNFLTPRKEGDHTDGGTVDSELGLSLGDLSCVTPDHPSSLSLDNSNWDCRSNKSSDAMSEVSVACLQDRILQMEETHYSTSEELQATLQELTDLQDSVNELSNENERLADEKSVLLESLCAQTEKLENCRMQIEQLKVLIVSENDTKDRSEHERQLLELLRSSQVEREELLLKQQEYTNALITAGTENRENADITEALRDKISLLEAKNESLLADRKDLDKQVSELKEALSKEEIELTRYKTLLDNEKAKVAEIEQCRNAVDKSDLEDLLHNARQEKDKVEAKLANTQEALAHSQNEVTKVKEHLSTLEEEMKVARNNAKTQVSDVEYKLEQLKSEKLEMQQQADSLRDHIDQLEQDCDRYLEEKKTYTTKVAHMQNELRKEKQHSQGYLSETKELKARFDVESKEWEQFHADLKTAIVIANDIKTETQEDMERLATENSQLRERTSLLQTELNKVNQELDRVKAQRSSSREEIRGRVISSVDKELMNLRQRKLSDPHGGKDNMSVKTLIMSIEHKGPPTKSSSAGIVLSPTITSPTRTQSQESSRRNSTDSITSLQSDTSSPKSPGLELRRGSAPPETQLKSALKKPPESKDKRSTPRDIIYETPPGGTDDAKAVASTSKNDPDSALKKSPAITSILSSNARRNSVR